MKPITFYFAIALFFLSTACEEVVELEIPKEAYQIVVEGIIVNKAGESYVKLYKTTPYFSDDEAQDVRGAVVTVTDGLGNAISFHETTNGFFICPADFKGTPGHTYFLRSEAEGKIITGISTMPDSVQLINLRLENIAEKDGPLQEGYHLYGTLTDNPHTNNYYKVERFINGQRQQTTANDLVVFDDLFFDGLSQVEGILWHWAPRNEGDNLPKKDDIISVKLYALTGEAYHYFKALKESPSQGGLFGKNPANVPSNTVGALGLFHASAYTFPDSIIVSE